MAKTYKKNSFGRMSWVVYERPWFWQLVALAVVFAGIVVNYVSLALAGLGLNLDVLDLSWKLLVIAGIFSFAGITFYRVAKFTRTLKRLGRISDYLLENKQLKP